MGWGRMTRRGGNYPKPGKATREDNSDHAWNVLVSYILRRLRAGYDEGHYVAVDAKFGDGFYSFNTIQLAVREANNVFGAE